MDSNLSPNLGNNGRQFLKNTKNLKLDIFFQNFAGQRSNNYIQASPAQDALSELFDLPAPAHDDSVSNDFMKMGDANRYDFHKFFHDNICCCIFTNKIPPKKS